MNFIQDVILWAEVYIDSKDQVYLHLFKVQLSANRHLKKHLELIIVQMASCFV